MRSSSFAPPRRPRPFVSAPVFVTSMLWLTTCGGPDQPAKAPPPAEIPSVVAPTTPPVANADSESDIEEARWIASHQSGDGRWEAAGWDRWRRGERVTGERLPGLGSASLDVAVTSLALLAYAGAGYTSASEGLQGAVVAWGLHALLELQESEGAFGDPKVQWCGLPN